MKHLIIVGARGWGREVSWLATGCVGYGTKFDIKGFLDDKADALDGLGDYPPILGPVETYIPKEEDVFVIALGYPGPKMEYARKIKEKGGRFTNLIHKEAVIHPTAELGVGLIVDARASISANTKIGNFVTFQRDATVGHDAVIGDGCMLNSFSFMGGYATLGEGSELATMAQIIPHVHVGSNCMVGAGSVVIRKVKDNTTVFGVPAKKVEY